MGAGTEQLRNLSFKSKLNKLLDEQRNLQTEQDRLESRWMEAEEALAEMTERFEQDTHG